jgi:hypothetical protein
MPRNEIKNDDDDEEEEGTEHEVAEIIDEVDPQEFDERQEFLEVTFSKETNVLSPKRFNATLLEKDDDKVSDELFSGFVEIQADLFHATLTVKVSPDLDKRSYKLALFNKDDFEKSDKIIVTKRKYYVKKV